MILGNLTEAQIYELIDSIKNKHSRSLTHLKALGAALISPSRSSQATITKIDIARTLVYFGKDALPYLAEYAMDEENGLIGLAIMTYLADESKSEGIAKKLGLPARSSIIHAPGMFSKPDSAGETVINSRKKWWQFWKE